MKFAFKLDQKAEYDIHIEDMRKALANFIEKKSLAKKNILQAADKNNCSIIHYLVAAGISNNGKLWDLLETASKQANWEQFVQIQLETLCSLPDLTGYPKSPQYPHELLMKFLQFGYEVSPNSVSLVPYFITIKPEIMFLKSEKEDLFLSTSFLKNILNFIDTQLEPSDTSLT